MKSAHLSLHFHIYAIYTLQNRGSSGVKVICQSTKYVIEFRLFNLGTWDGKKWGSITIKFPRTRARIPCDFMHFAFTTFTKLGSVS